VPPLDKIQNQQELDKAIATLDTALFDSYNRCDLEKFSSFFVDDVEFYHDQGGLTLGKVALTDSVKKNICGKVTRELVPGTMQVYHMKGYGAIEMGIHRFHHPGHEDTEGVGEGRGSTFKNPVTGEPHLANVDLPDGFIWKKGQCGSGTFRVSAAGLSIASEKSNWILYDFDWANG